LDSSHKSLSELIRTEKVLSDDIKKWMSDLAQEVLAEINAS
jgi:hypothetical protein